MTKNLVIVESPAKAKTITKYLGKDFLLKASFGHVRDLPTYTLGVNVKEDFSPIYKNIKDKSKLLKELKKLGKEAEQIYIATDPDREGEAIAWHLQESCGLDPKKVKRVVFYEITKTAVQGAIKKPRPLDMQLVDAQQARRVLDRLIGYKLSPVLSRKIRKGLSAGRVQSVAVKIICDREKEILAFDSKEYWVIETNVQPDNTKKTFTTKLFAINNEKEKLEVDNKKQADSIVAKLNEATYSINNLKKTKVTKNPTPPFITSSLQQEASRKLNWTTKKTMLIAQQLYEGITIDKEQLGLITYMRTDSFRISNDAKKAAKDYITKKFGAEYIPEKERVYKQKKMAQDAHEAIRPSYIEQDPKTLQPKITSDHYKLYKLIWERFMASQMSSGIVENTQVTVAATNKAEKFLLRCNGNIVLFDGFSKLYSEGKDQQENQDVDQNLPDLKKDESLKLNNIESAQKFTQPPSRFTEASLVRELEEKGIGRPSTYAPTLSTIQDRGYINREKKMLHPTELGLIVNEKLEQFFSKIIDIKYTAKLENLLDEIMEGKHEWKKVIEDLYTPFSEMIQNAYDKMEKINTDKPSDEICEKCKKPMVIKTGRYGEFIACTGFPECKNTKPIKKALDITCPDCKKPLLEKTTKRGKIFYGCSGYPECTFAAWDKPVNEPCPKCKAPYLLIKKSKGGESKYCEKCKKKDSKDS